MLSQEILDLYKKSRLMTYRAMFGRIREKTGSLSATEAYAVDVIYLLGSPTITQLAETLGFAHITTLSCAEHDKMIGYVSQLTHAIAVSLMNANDSTHLAEYTGDSFRDLTRIAKINEHLWSELFLLNKENLTAEIDQFCATLQDLKAKLAADDAEGLRKLFLQSTARRKWYDKK